MFILTLISVIFLIQIFSLQNLKCAAAQTTTSTTEINDIQFWSKKGDLSGANLKIEIGAHGGLEVEQSRDLLSLTPMGQEPYGEYTKMKAKAIFAVDLNFYSNALPLSSTFSNAKQVERSQKYARVILCTKPTLPSSWGEPTDYYVKYSDWDLSSASLTSKAQGFSGRVPISAKVEDLTPSSLNFGTTQFNVQAKSFVAQVNEISVKSSSAYQISQYTDFFNAEMNNDAGLSILDLTKTATINGGGQDTSSLNVLGLSVYGTTYPNVQQKQLQTLTINQDDLLERGIPINLKPEVYKVVQQLKLTSQNKILIDTEKNWWDINDAGVQPAPQYSDPIQTNTDIYRTIGWHVNNYCVRTTLLVECDVYSIIEVVGKTSSNPLGSVDISVGNLTWSNSQGSNGGTFTLSNDLFTQIGANISKWFEDNQMLIIIIIIGVGLALIGYVYFFTPVGSAIRGIQTSRRE